MANFQFRGYQVKIVDFSLNKHPKIKPYFEFRATLFLPSRSAPACLLCVRACYFWRQNNKADAKIYRFSDFISEFWIIFEE